MDNIIPKNHLFLSKLLLLNFQTCINKDRFLKAAETKCSHVYLQRSKKQVKKNLKCQIWFRKTNQVVAWEKLLQFTALFLLVSPENSLETRSHNSSLRCLVEISQKLHNVMDSEVSLQKSRNRYTCLLSTYFIYPSWCVIWWHDKLPENTRKR